MLFNYLVPRRKRISASNADKDKRNIEAAPVRRLPHLIPKGYLPGMAFRAADKRIKQPFGHLVNQVAQPAEHLPRFR